ncbi:MAG TPA: OsmC family protein [Candidatus Limnocylindria bacterium]
MKTARARLVGDGSRFRIASGSGHAVTVDTAEGNTGARPAELLLMALAGCTGMDVIAILRKKRQPVERYEISVAGEQRQDHPASFERIVVQHIVHGRVDPEAVRRAVELSATRYCAVGATLSSGATAIAHRYRLLADGAVVEAEVCVTGPHRRIEPSEHPAALAG